MVFILSALWWRRIRGLWNLPDGRDWLRGKLDLVPMGRAMLSKSLIQFSIDGRGCVPSLVFDLRPDHGGGNEDNGALHCCTLCLQPCCRSPPTHSSARASWTLMHKSGSVSHGVTAPFSWILAHTRFCLCPPKVCFAKVGSREIPGVTGKFGLGVQNEAGQRLTEFCQENTLVIANTLFQQQKRRLYTWTSPDGQYRNQIDYILCSQRWRSSIQSAKRRLGADCGSDHELLIAKITLKLKKVEKTTRQFRYDLNQILYDYTVEVTKRLKGLDLIECLKKYGHRFMTLYRRQGTRPSSRKRNAKRQNGCLRRLYK